MNREIKRKRGRIIMKKRILTLAVLAMMFTNGCSSNSDMKALEGTWMGEEGGIVFYEPMEKNGFSGSATIIDDGDSKDGEYEIDDKAKRLNLSYSDGWGTPVTAMYTYDLNGKELELTLVKYKDVTGEHNVDDGDTQVFEKE